MSERLAAGSARLTEDEMPHTAERRRGVTIALGGVIVALLVLGLAGLWLRDVAGFNVPGAAYDLAEQQAREGAEGYEAGGVLGRHSGWGDCAIFEVLDAGGGGAGSTYHLTVIRRDSAWEVGRVSGDGVGFDTDDVSTGGSCRQVSDSTGQLVNGSPA